MHHELLYGKNSFVPEVTFTETFSLDTPTKTTS